MVALRGQGNWRWEVKNNVYMYKTESLFYIAEIGTTLKINYTSIKNKFKKIKENFVELYIVL